MENPIVSICIPTYNGEMYLQEALDSVKIQTYKNIEVIVSDDNSKDATLEIIENFKNEVDFPVFIYKHKPNGIGANWNNCIERANGEYIKFLFQDDVLKFNCIEVMINYLLRYKLEIVISKRQIIDENSDLVTKGEWYDNFNDLQIPADLNFNDFFVFRKRTINEINFKRFVVDNIFGEPCVSLFSKKIYKKVGPYNLDLKQCLDYIYLLRILRYYNIGIIEEKLVSFRIHNEQTSNVNSRNKVNEVKIIKDYIYKFYFFNLNFKNKKKILIHKYPNLYDLFAKFFR